MRRTFFGRVFRLILWFIMVCAALWGLKWATVNLFPMPYRDAVQKAAEETGVSEKFLYAVMKAESNFAPSAESHKGAKGIMQMMPETANWCAQKMGKKSPDLSDPVESISVGAYYLGYLKNLYGGDETLAAAAYNAGHGRVDGWLSDKAYSKDGKSLSKIPFPETEKYVKKVMLYKKIYEKRLEKRGV